MFRCDACDANVEIRKPAGQMQVLIGRTLRGVNCCPSCTRRLDQAAKPPTLLVNGVPAALPNPEEVFDFDPLEARSAEYAKIRSAADHVANRKLEAWRKEQAEKIASQREYSTKEKVAKKMGTPDAFVPLAPALTLAPVNAKPEPSHKPTGKRKKDAPVKLIKKPAAIKRFA